MPMGKKVLLLTSEQELGVFAAVGFLSRHGLDASEVSVVTGTGSLAGGKLHAGDASVDAVLSVSPVAGFHGPGLLKEIRRVLRPGGSLTVEEPVAARALTPSELQGLGGRAVLGMAEVEKALLFAGFSDAAAASGVEGIAPISAGYGSLAAAGGPLAIVGVSAKKPNWEVGAKQSLKLRKKPAAKADMGAVASAWNAAASGEGDLIDEDTLLMEEDRITPTAVPKSDCSTSRKACANCVCGRAEREATDGPGSVVQLDNPNLTQDQIDNPQSACGSCGLGDAFRCATCPYRGMPTFKLGEKVSIGADLLAADI